uniref:ATP synthase complex subunit 8 n=1 Tax=Rhacophorus poecilonotus TaxID=1969350 RepID=A0A343KQP1_9NEOB|nr:ATP synthase F0 subunit 8 [Rhacophorus poecilonotus]
MPQLAPEPWFLIFFSSWIIFILFTPTKILNHHALSDPDLKITEPFYNFWAWPWQ